MWQSIISGMKTVESLNGEGRLRFLSLAARTHSRSECKTGPILCEMRLVAASRVQRLPIPWSLPLIVFSLFWFSASLWAVDPNSHITQYAHTAWRVQDGDISGAPNAITQTGDGYLWIATMAGLVRFDGVRFVPWGPQDAKHIYPVYSLLTTRDGSLWMGTGGKIAHLKNGTLLSSQDSFGRVNGILEDSHGTLWIARSRFTDGGGPLCEVAGKKLRCYGSADGISTPGANALTEDSNGNLWIGASDGLVRRTGGSFTAYEPKSLNSARGLDGVEALAAARDGSLWAGIGSPGPSLGLEQFRGGVWSAFASPHLNGGSLSVSAVFIDHRNTIWVGTHRGGIYRISDGRVEHFSSADGLSGDSVTGFYEDREGNLWVATSEGIDRFRDTRVLTFSTREGLSSADVYSVLAARDGTIWMGNHGALDALRQGTVKSIDAKHGLPGQEITSLLEDHSGDLWVGVDNGLFVYEHGRFTPIKRPDGTPVGIVLAITEDHNHEVWAEVLQPPRLIRIKDRAVVEELSEPKMPPIDSLAADPEDGIWLGFVNGGLARYRHGVLENFETKHNHNSMISQLLVRSPGLVLGATQGGVIAWQNGKVQTLTTRNGLPCDSVHSLLLDNHDALWLYAACGVIRIDNAEIQEWLEQPSAKIKTQVLDTFDGARPHGVPFTPHATRSPDGRLWFATETVVQMIDPDRVTSNAIPPPVQVENVLVDHKTYPPRNGVQLPPLIRNLQIDYTALSFVTPQKVYFRYKLEGHDPDWQEAGTRRQAFYSDLRPGQYRFRVVACNNDGLWNEVGATWDFSIAPAWFQTIWFRILCAVLVAFILWMLYRLRLRQVEHQFHVALEARVDERMRIARDFHDTLLQSFQGLLLRFQAASNFLPQQPQEAKRKLDQVIEQASEAIAEGRDALQGLRTSTTVTNDLAAALKTVGEEVAAEKIWEIEPEFEVLVAGHTQNLHPIVRDEVYRIAAEALRNAFHHADARHITVEISYDAHRLRVKVCDDGRGIDPSVSEKEGSSGHWGIPGMRERAKLIGGNVDIWSKIREGTAVELTIPASTAYDVSASSRFSNITEKEM